MSGSFVSPGRGLGRRIRKIGTERIEFRGEIANSSEEKEGDFEIFWGIRHQVDIRRRDGRPEKFPLERFFRPRPEQVYSDK
jgi:hypothetical protein